MKFLKPLFFSKYKPIETYDYPNWQDVSFVQNKKKLSILLQETAEPVRGVVVLAHPMKTEGKQFFVQMKHDKLYQKLGLHTVIFDFNGFGDSENHGFDFASDVYSVLLKAKELYPNLPLFIHGVSFGGSQIILGTLKDENLVNGLIIESAVSSSLEYYQHRGYKAQFNVLNVYKYFDWKWTAQNTYSKTVQQVRQTPLLFIYGTKDVITPLWMGEKLYDNANQPKQLEIFDTEHLTIIQEEPERYEQALIDFIEPLL